MSDTIIPVRKLRTPTASVVDPQTDSWPETQASDAEAKLVAFVNQQIEKMRSHVQFQAGREPSFFEVNQALLSYQDTNLGLLALHNTAKMENTRAKEVFEDWYADKYLILREEMNPRSLSAQKWVSQREIEMAVRVRYKEEYHKYNWDVIITEQQLAFMRRLLEGWSSYQYVLTQLSKNLVSELNGLGVENALDRAANRNG